MEYCDNLISHRRAALDQLGQRLLDANRTIGQPKKITTIFGRKVTRHYKGKLQTIIEDLDLPNPVIRSHYGNGFLKQYVRDHLCLRTELATNDVTDYGVKKAVENLPPLRDKLAGICDNYLTVQQDILETAPTITSKQKGRCPMSTTTRSISSIPSGATSLKISGHPPFPAQVILNGHEYVACQASPAPLRSLRAKSFAWSLSAVHLSPQPMLENFRSHQPRVPLRNHLLQPIWGVTARLC